MKKHLFALALTVSAFVALPSVVLADASPTPSPQVDINVSVGDNGGGTQNVNTNTNSNTNNNNINITNTNSTLASVPTFPTRLPATGASPFALAGLVGALPLGLALRKYKRA